MPSLEEDLAELKKKKCKLKFLEIDWEKPDVDHWDVDTPCDTNKELLDVLGIGPV
jgi:hypothetical protein